MSETILGPGTAISEQECYSKSSESSAISEIIANAIGSAIPKAVLFLKL